MKKKFPYWLTILIFLSIGVSSWSLYNLLNQAVTDMLLKVGVVNFYLQNIIIIVFVFIVLLIIGYGGKKALNSIIK